MEETFDQNPMVLGAVAAAVGLAIGMTLPATEREARLMGGRRDELIDKVTGKGTQKSGGLPRYQKVSNEEAEPDEIEEQAPVIVAGVLVLREILDFYDLDEIEAVIFGLPSSPKWSSVNAAAICPVMIVANQIKERMTARAAAIWGVDPSAVDITLERGVLTISGERAQPAPTEGEQMVQRRIERGHGSFHRRFILPDSVDAEKVKATDRAGVLEITIPKQQKAQPRRIKVAA